MSPVIYATPPLAARGGARLSGQGRASRGRRPPAAQPGRSRLLRSTLERPP